MKSVLKRLAVIAVERRKSSGVKKLIVKSTATINKKMNTFCIQYIRIEIEIRLIESNIPGGWNHKLTIFRDVNSDL